MEIGRASRPAAGEVVCGDVAVVVTRDEEVLLCLADGLGHGPSAQVAAEAACRVAREGAGQPLEALLRAMDAALAPTRGAAVSLLCLEHRRARAMFAGIGNVEIRAGARVAFGPPTMPGIVGRGIRTVRVWTHSLTSGDTFILHSDGISSRFDLAPLLGMSAQAIADALVASHHKAHDDAFCIVVRTP